ncbi:MAG: TAXI family TRAP transporter solute-binding subunit [Methyloligellaceae bacterium]
MTFSFVKTVSIASALAIGTIGLTAQSFAASIGVGSTKGGATAQVTAGLSKIVSSSSGHQLRPQPMGGTQQYIPIVNAGELEFGVSNVMQYYMAITGTGLSEGKKNADLRMVATLMTFRTGMFVANSSGIKSIADLKGKRVPGEFTASPLFKFLMEANLANAGLSWKDVNVIPMTALRQHWDAFGQGKVDVAIGAIGSGPIKKLNSAVGGVTFLSLENAGEAANRTLKLAPKTTINTVKPAKPFVGIKAPTNAIHFAYTLWAHKGVDNKIVEDVVKAIYDNEKGLHELSPLWRSHKSKGMGRQFGADVPYHPGAVNFYKKAGIWSGN